MATVVRVSSKYQVAIPRPLREAAGIKPGMEFEVIVSGGGLRLIPLVPLAALRGRVRRNDGLEVREKVDRC